MQEPYSKPRHYAGFAMALLGCVEGICVYVLRDQFTLNTLLVAIFAAVSVTCALGLWLAPNKIEPLFRDRNLRVFIFTINPIIAVFGLLLAAPQLGALLNKR